MRPVIKISLGAWRCGTHGGVWCYGPTPQAAYSAWLKWATPA